ncbi:MAG: NAD(P)/FAD-dependent oxidoreductase [Flavobacteriales bacterium]|jgi:predicted Rossmann fold flavoprotein
MAKLVVIGGGAAGFFGAIRAAECLPGLEVWILEKSGHTLSKVRISGGGRCNVTHACFEPGELVQYYPRGHRELRGPFSAFQPGDTMQWFGERGVELKTEEDGRIFPVTDKSSTIVDCLEESAGKAGVRVLYRSGAVGISRMGERWLVSTGAASEVIADALLITTGSSPQVWEMLRKAGHTIVEPVPSLFTFNCRDARINELPGVVAPQAEVSILSTRHQASGPVLVTHWGFSGPGILKLSAWAARELAGVNYDFTIRINWDMRYDSESLAEELAAIRQREPRKQLLTFSPVNMPLRLWVSLVTSVADPSARWSDTSNATLRRLAEAVCCAEFRIRGKSTFKEEFVTAGGVALREVDFRTMASKILPSCWLAGEVLDIDAVTGGFNFQAAWTTSWIAGGAIARHLAHQS